MIQFDPGRDRRPWFPTIKAWVWVVTIDFILMAIAGKYDLLGSLAYNSTLDLLPLWYWSALSVVGLISIQFGLWTRREVPLVAGLSIHLATQLAFGLSVFVFGAYVGAIKWLWCALISLLVAGFDMREPVTEELPWTQ